MYTKHINNMVLYAKCLYAHTDNVVEDCKVMWQLDHPGRKAPKDNDEFLELVNEDYRMWVNSMNITEKDGPDKDCSKSVSWCDDPVAARLFSILISYDIYVQMTGRQLLPPVYACEPLCQRPQFDTKCVNGKNIFDGITKENYIPAVCSLMVEKIISKTNIDIINEGFDSIIGSCFGTDDDCSREREFLKKSVETIRKYFDTSYDEKCFRREILNARDEFFLKYKEDSWLEGDVRCYQDKRYTIRTKYFIVSVNAFFNGRNGYLSIVDVAFAPYSLTVHVQEREVKSSPKEMLDLVMRRLDEVTDYKMFDNILRGRVDECYDDDNVKKEKYPDTRDYIKNTIDELIFIKTSLYDYPYLEETTVRTGYLQVAVTSEKKSFLYKTYNINIMTYCEEIHSYMPNRLYNQSNNSVDGVKL